MVRLTLSFDSTNKDSKHLSSGGLSLCLSKQLMNMPLPTKLSHELALQLLKQLKQGSQHPKKRLGRKND